MATTVAHATLDAPPSPRVERWRPDIDGLRAVAVLLVVGYHAWPSLLPGGYVGVDIFFVISGFLITGIIVRELADDRFSFLRFYARRARRILPALFITLLTSLVLGWYVLLGDDFKALGRHVVGATFFMANYLLMAEVGYFDAIAETKPLLHLWSLAIEEQFYLTLPLLLWLAWRRRTALRSLLVVLGGGSLLLNLWLSATHSTAAFYLPLTRAWELMAGAVLVDPTGAITERLASTRLTHGLSIGGIALIAASLALAAFSGMPDPFLVLLAVAGGALLIVAGPAASANRVLLSRRVLVVVGLCSFPLYLWHWLLLSFLRNYAGHDGAVPHIPLAIAIAFVLAWLTYWFVERPVRTGVLSGRAVARVFTTLAALTIAAGLTVWGQAGFPGRSGLRLRAMAEFARSPHEPIWNDACGALLRNVEGLDLDACISSSSGPASLVLLGDSHANQYYKSLARKLPTTPVLHMGRFNCLPFSSKTHQTEKCQRSIANSRDYIMGQRTVSTVVLAGYWNYLMAGRFSSQSADYREAAPPAPNETDVFLRRGHDVIAALQAAGKRVVLILDAPNLNFNIEHCVYDVPGPQGRPTVPPGCAMPRQAFEARNAPYDEVMARLAAGLPGLKVFDPRMVLCDKTACSAMRQGRSLYFDSDHLSLRGTDLVIDALIASRLLDD